MKIDLKKELTETDCTSAPFVFFISNYLSLWQGRKLTSASWFMYTFGLYVCIVFPPSICWSSQVIHEMISKCNIDYISMWNMYLLCSSVSLVPFHFSHSCLYTLLTDSQGEKNIIKFEGDHNSPRPQFYFDSISIFFNNVLQTPADELRSTLFDLSPKYFGEVN